MAGTPAPCPPTAHAAGHSRTNTRRILGRLVGRQRRRGARAAQVFGNSPDETAYCRLVLNRETVPDALVMLQPTLLAYSLDAPPQPVRAVPAPGVLLPIASV